MEKKIDCCYWKEYQGLNGWIMFCSAGAYAKKFDRQYAEKIGCTEEKKPMYKNMEMNIGYSLLPEITSQEIKAVTPATRELATKL